MLALVLLSLGLLVKPVLVAACEVDDLRLAHASGGVAASDAGGGLNSVESTAHADATNTGTAAASSASGSELAGDACCAGKACSACCTSVTVLPLASMASWLAPAHDSIRPGVAVAPDPSTQPVAIRPPIAA